MLSRRTKANPPATRRAITVGARASPPVEVLGDVLPEKTLGQMNMMRWIEAYESLGITARPFEHVEDAKRWLEEQPAT